MTGRWPANVILSPGMAEELDKQSGISKSGTAVRRNGVDHDSPGWGMGRHDPGTPDFGYKDEGGASRFFLNAGYEPWELEWILANGLRPCGMEEA